MIDLSVLICSVTQGGRVASMLPRIAVELHRQTLRLPNVEIIAFTDNKRRSVGEKRNDLINIANGKYVVFIDDDDLVEQDYVVQLLEAIKQDTDVICFGAKRYVNNIFDRDVKYGVQYRKDFDTPDCYYRIPNHLMCFRRDLAISVSFKPISFGEDAQWAKDIFYKIKTSHTIDKCLYHYYFSPETTETQK